MQCQAMQSKAKQSKARQGKAKQSKAKQASKRKPLYHSPGERKRERERETAPTTDSEASFHQQGREGGGLGPSLFADSSPAEGRKEETASGGNPFTLALAKERDSLGERMNSGKWSASSED